MMSSRSIGWVILACVVGGCVIRRCVIGGREDVFGQLGETLRVQGEHSKGPPVVFHLGFQVKQQVLIQPQLQQMARTYDKETNKKRYNAEM